jgi:cell division protein FtsW (lipid II flippase)
MRIVRPTSGSPRPWAARPMKTQPAARLERLGLIAASIVTTLGLALTYVGQTSEIGACPDPDRACVLNLSTVEHSGEIEPWLTRAGTAAERTFVAEAIFARLADPDARRPEHVGALAGITVPSDRVRADTDLAGLNARLGNSGAETLRVLSGADLAALKPSVVVRTLPEYRTRILLLWLVFMASFWATHALRAWRGTTGDGLLLPVAHLLTGLGLMALIATRDPLRDMVIAWTAVGGIAAGCLLWTAASVVDFENPRWRRAMLAPLGGAVALAAALLLFGGGPAGSGARVNLWGGQPVEAIRLLIAFALAAYFARRWTFLREYSEEIMQPSAARHLIRLPRWRDARPLVLAIGTLLVFFFLQRDLGPALVFSCVFLALYGVARGHGALVLCGLVVVIAGFAAGYVIGVPATVTTRVAMWLDPWRNALAGGDQVAHALWALASGGAWGLGPGIGDPQYVPAAHTDLVVAALGEELGFAGVLSVLALLALLVWRLLAIALRAPGDYTFFLALALTLLLAVQAVVIVSGTLGMLPLAGVVAPFLSYGRSSMISNLALVGICAAIAIRRGPRRTAFVVPVRAIRWTLAVAALALTGRAALVQVVRADSVATEANLTEQADGGFRFQYNPRLLAAGRGLARGTIFDRNGIPLATSRPAERLAVAEAYAKLGMTPDCPPAPATGRCYPLGGMAFHLLGEADRQTNWAARNASFVERDMDARLKGFDDRPQTVEVTHPRTGRTVMAVKRDYTELLPLVRHKARPGHRDVRQLMERSRDVHLTVDAGLQALVAQALRDHVTASGAARGAAVVLDPSTGALLASVSYPWPDAADLAGFTIPAAERLLDRARYGLYPPGSTFKIVTAVAALRSAPREQDTHFQCVRLPDGRVGGRVPGVARPVRDDAQNTVPHGRLDLHRALVVSCNAYFANLAHRLGSVAIADAAAAAQLSVAPEPARIHLERTLPHAGYGQGEVVATPLRMARATAALASDGVLRDVTLEAATPPAAGVRWLDAAGAARLRRDLRDAVTTGTGRALASHAVAIAGKTGTAEVDGMRSHAWFVGFAPSQASRTRIALAVIVENGGYGGRVAAPLAGEIVSAARARGLLP